MARLARSVLIVLLSLVGSTLALAQTVSTGPSTTTPPYLRSHLPGTVIESILTVGDGTVVPKVGGGATRLAGIPDGIGVIDGDDLSPPEPGIFWLYMNHELNATQGIARDHGQIGAFVSAWKIDKTTHEVLEGDDLIKEYYDWDEDTSSFVLGTGLFDRMCSSDLPPRTAFYNSATGLGTQEFLYMNGEESSGGRALGTVVTGPDAGKAYHLEHLGFAAYENVLASPFEQDLTIVALTDDASNGEVYFYVGTKQSTGTDVERAGLVGGNLYALAVPGKPFERADVIAAGVLPVEAFALKLIGAPGNRPADGVEVEARGADTLTPVDPAQTFESLKMGGPEDGAWDTRPGFENRFYFVTKGTASGGLTANTRLWLLEFSDMTNPAAGGTMSLLLDGPENRLGSLDNMCFTMVDGAPHLFIQEDLGGQAELSIIWDYDITTGQLEEVVSHDPQTFFIGGSSFLTTNEESSGVISLADVLGDGWYAASVQVHTNLGLPDSTELVEYGQLCFFNLAARGADLVRERVVASGDAWSYRIDGVTPDSEWREIGFALLTGWNTTLGGTVTGPAPTPIGYGEAPGVLATDVGQPSVPRPAAYYFRKEFDVTNPSGVILLDLYLRVDDGAVVYVNGTEVDRYNVAADAVVDNDTLASANESSERDWKRFRVVCDDLAFPLQATGNVIAVSVHQENDASSDIRMDLELITWSESPDPGTAPSVPTGLAVAAATQTSIELEWDAQSDAKFFRIERKASADVVYEVIENEFPGVFASYVDTNVMSGTTYEYRLAAFNIYGRSACTAPVEGMTQVSLLPVIFEENFEVADSFGQFTRVDVAEPGAGYSWLTTEGTGAIQGNGFGSGLGATEDWLITTDPINFIFFRNETLEYDSQISFSGPAPEVLYSTDYDPAIHADPNLATWELLHTDLSMDGTLTVQGPFDLSVVPSLAHFAFKYTSDGGAGGQSVRWRFDDVLVKGDCGFDFEGGEGTDIEADPSTPWIVVNRGSAFGWIYDTYAGQQSAINNNFGSAAGGTLGIPESDDWLISPEFFASDPATVIEFQYYENFGDTVAQPLSVLVTDDYTGDPATTTWTDITPVGLDGSTTDAYIDVTTAPIGVTGRNLRVAFHYISAGTTGGTTKRIGVDNVCIALNQGPLKASLGFTREGAEVSFVPNVSGGAPPYSFDWTFGDGEGSTEAAPTHTYTAEGVFTVGLTVMDDAGTTVTLTEIDLITVTNYETPAPIGQLRIATFNASMNRPASGTLAADLASGVNAQIQEVAEVIQRANPDVLLVNEFDQIYDEFGAFDLAATLDSIDDFRANYLEVAQSAETTGIVFPYVFVAPCNTGVPSGLDFDNNGSTSDAGDAYGFGDFPGQYAMVLLSKYPFADDARTFQLFRWVDMPGALLPPDPQDTDGDGETDSFYSDAELEVFRLSSKSHWDVPVLVDGQVVHVLCSHPTPPVFDDGTTGVDPDVADFNGLRNHDEIRFWADYIDPAQSGYIYDDAEWAAAGGMTPASPVGGLAAGARFVIVGDQNADPVDGDATFDPIDQLLSSALVDVSITPTSDGALEQVPAGFMMRETKTASFNLRADYVLPSVEGWTLNQAFVLWPLTTDFEADLLSASDHRLVAIDADLVIPAPQFVRGDCNADGAVQVSDAVTTFGALFSGGMVPCEAACDSNADGVLDIADGVYLLNFLFVFGPAPTSPYPGCGVDPGSPLTCESFSACP